jgi:crotonobetainyl-CoA:carnitine CoA-transferase CaiB-like acyl-CoA transferase
VEIEASLSSRSAAEWESLLNGAGVPAGRVLSVPEALELEQVRQRGLVQTIEDGGPLRKLRLITGGYRIAGAGKRLDRPPPKLGEHTEEVLSSVGYSAGELAELRSEGAI